MTTCDKCEAYREHPTAPRDPVAAAIRNVRTEMKVNQADFAAMIGIRQPMVAQMEHGRRKPSPGLVYRLAKVSGKPLETFVEEHYEEQIG
jgi:transcriptional regulator with XRE-family HTH domain